MKRLLGRATLAVGVTVAVLLPVVTTSEVTQARWSDSVTASLPDGTTDRFTSTAVNVPSTRGAMVNTPTVQASNTAERHQGWTNVTGVSLGSGQLGGQSLASAIGLNYAVTPPGGACTGTTTSYWAARTSGQITLGTTYPRPTDRVAAALLSPGQQHNLCMTFPRAGTDQAFLLTHAGRDLVVRSFLGQRSEGPATFDSTAQTVDSTFAVAFPRPTPRANNFSTVSQSCARTGLTTIQLRWAWPDATVTSTTTSPAVDRWQIWGRTAGSNNAWTQYASTPGNRRTIDISTLSLLTASFEFKIIARLDSGSTYWVESTHLIFVNNLLVLPSCDGVTQNTVPNPGGPVVLP